MSFGINIPDYEKNAATHKITRQIKNPEWIYIDTDSAVAYDKNTFSFDSENSIVYGYFKIKTERKIYYNWIYMSYPNGKVLWIDNLENGAVTSDSSIRLVENLDSDSEKQNQMSKSLYNYFGKEFGINRGKKKKIDLLKYHDNKVKKEIKEIGTPKYIVQGHTGSTKVLAKGSLALVAENVKIKCYISPSFSRSTEVVISKLPLEMRVIKINDSRPLDYGGKAKLIKEIHITKEEKQNNPTKIFTVPKDSTITVELKLLNENEYKCLVPIEGKTVSVALKDDMFIPVVPHNWYRVVLPNNNLTAWIDGKYLTGVIVNSSYNNAN